MIKKLLPAVAVAGLPFLLPNLALAGAPYDGVGLAACISSGQRAAASLAGRPLRTPAAVR